MSDLEGFLHNQDVGVSISGEKLHIGVALVEQILTAAEIFDVAEHTILVTTAAGVPAGGITTALALGAVTAGPVVGLAGVFMALGSGYLEAREEIESDAVASGFSQGFVAGILNMSPQTTSYLFGRHGVIPNHPMDPEADVIEMKARNRGLFAGYTFANTANAEQKKAFVFEIRAYAGDVPVGNWTDLDKRNYVVEYAAKLRKHFLQ